MLSPPQQTVTVAAGAMQMEIHIQGDSTSESWKTTRNRT